MNLELTRQQIEKEVSVIVLSHFIPKVVSKIMVFSGEISDSVAFKERYRTITGYDISCEQKTLDLRGEETFLIKSITDLILIKTHGSRNQK